MTRPVFPKNLLIENINEENKLWLARYKEEKKLGKGYISKLDRFFHFYEYENIPFNEFTTADVEKIHLVMIDNNFDVSAINSLNSALSGYKSFLIDKYPSVFPKDFLDDLTYFDDQNTSDAIELNMNQIHLIREFNCNNIKHEFIFEIYFQLDIKKKDINQCLPKFNNTKLYCFEPNSAVKIKYNTAIFELLKKVPKDHNFGVSESTVTYYFIKVAEYLRNQKPPAFTKSRALRYYDIVQSRKNYLINCPNCHRLTENISRYWVLAKNDVDLEYRLVCSVCKGE